LSLLLLFLIVLEIILWCGIIVVAASTRHYEYVVE